MATAKKSAAKKTTKSAKKSLTLKFDFERATKNTLRFQEQSDTPVVGTLYVQKSALGEDFEGSVNVTIEEA